MKDKGLPIEVSPSVDMFPIQKQKAVEDITNLSIGKVPGMMLAEECHRSDAKGKHALFVRRLREDNPETNPMKENPADAMGHADDAQSSDHEKTFSVMDWMLEAHTYHIISYISYHIIPISYHSIS